MQHTGGGEQPLGPIDPLLVPRFAGPATYARLPRLDQVDRCDVAVVGVPFDGGVTYRPGARFGPAAIRAGSRLMRGYHPGLDVQPFASQQVADAGDIACTPFDIAEAIEPDGDRRAGAARRRRRVRRARRRSHDRAAAAPGGARLARTGGARAFRRAPRHLGHLLRGGVHARHALPSCPRGRLARIGPLCPRRDPRPAVLAAGPRRRRGVRVHDRRRVRLPDAVGRVGGRASSAPALATRPCTSRSTSTSWTRRTPRARAPPRRAG